MGSGFRTSGNGPVDASRTLNRLWTIRLKRASEDDRRPPQRRCKARELAEKGDEANAEHRIDDAIAAYEESLSTILSR